MDTEKIAVPIAIIIAGLIIGGAVYFSSTNSAKLAQKANLPTNTAPTPTGNPRPVTSDDHILGNPNADLVIVEYSDTECPFCKQFNVTLNQVMTDYGKDGKVAWVYRHFPIDQLHTRARKESEATECSGDQGGNEKFWQMLEMIYKNTPSNNGLDPAQLPIYAKSISLDVKAFNTCLSSGKFTAKVDADYKEAVSIGGRGTPYSVIISKDGTKTPIEGAYPYDQLKTIIDGLLK